MVDEAAREYTLDQLRADLFAAMAAIRAAIRARAQQQHQQQQQQQYPTGQAPNQNQNHNQNHNHNPSQNQCLVRVQVVRLVYTVLFHIFNSELVHQYFDRVSPVTQRHGWDWYRTSRADAAGAGLRCPYNRTGCSARRGGRGAGGAARDG